MGRFKPFSRRRLGDRFRQWAALNRRLLTVLALGAVLLIAIETLIVVMFSRPSALNWYLLGATHAGGLVALVYGIHVGFLVHDRKAMQHLRGAWGEENTRSELAAAKRRRVIWDWVDSVAVGNGDIDHLVVTRSGGLIAIDSKWRSRTSAGDREEMARAASKVRLRAEALVRTVLDNERGSHRARSHTIQVKPVVVLWGALQHHLPEGARLEQIEVVAGRRLLPWLRQLNGDPVDKAAAKDLVKKLEEFRAGSWDG